MIRSTAVRCAGEFKSSNAGIVSLKKFSFEGRPLGIHLDRGSQDLAAEQKVALALGQRF
jgi:hypothetical protein